MEEQHLIDVLKINVDLIDESNRTAKENKENFNILECLTRFHLEELHSKFLGYLLDPKAEHDCGDIFLKFFLETIGVMGSSETTNATVVLERFIGRKDDTSNMYGFIDIYIETTSHIIVVENKLTAKDQEDQLLRYSNYCNSINNNNKKVVLFYLTLWGSKSPEAEKEENQMINYITISYRYTILQWLEKCMEWTELTNYKNILSGIKSYYDILKKRILHIPNHKAMESTITELQKNENRNILAEVEEICDALKQARKNVLQEFWCIVKAKVSEMLNEDWTIDFYTDEGVDDRHGHLGIYHVKNKNIHVCFEPLYCHYADQIEKCDLALWRNPSKVSNEKIKEYTNVNIFDQEGWVLDSKAIGKNKKMYAKDSEREIYAKELAETMLTFAETNLKYFKRKH